MKEKVFTLELMMSLTLIGLVFLSGTIYFKAVRFQRFMEPIIAVSKPKINFADRIRARLAKEFSEQNIKGVKFVNDSIVVDESLLNFIAHHGRVSAIVIIAKLGKVLLAILSDPELKPYIDLIIVNKTIPHSQDVKLNKKMRIYKQQRAELMLSALYTTTPELETKYGIYFTATAVSEYYSGKSHDDIELRFIQTNKIQIDFIKEFQKYLN